MRITDVKIRFINGQSRLRALASIVFDDAFVVHEIRIIEGKNGLFVAMPSRTNSDGSFKDVAHPISAEAREVIEKAILEAYEKEKSNK